MKFQDLKNNIASGYVFEIDDFAKFEGKTGPYIQYAIARINSILRKAGEIKPGKIVITNPEERDLALKLMQLNNIVLRTHEVKEPSIISDYAYTLRRRSAHSTTRRRLCRLPRRNRLPHVCRLPKSSAMF